MGGIVKRRLFGACRWLQRMRKTIGKPALAAATRSRIAPAYSMTEAQQPQSLEASQPPYSGRTL